MTVMCSVLSRVLEPTVMMEMSLSDGSVHSFEVSCCFTAFLTVILTNFIALSY